jgi:hypothetical protein
MAMSRIDRTSFRKTIAFSRRAESMRGGRPHRLPSASTRSQRKISAMLTTSTPQERKSLEQFEGVQNAPPREPIEAEDTDPLPLSLVCFLPKPAQLGRVGALPRCFSAYSAVIVCLLIAYRTSGGVRGFERGSGLRVSRNHPQRKRDRLRVPGSRFRFVPTRSERTRDLHLSRMRDSRFHTLGGIACASEFIYQLLPRVKARADPRAVRAASRC